MDQSTLKRVLDTATQLFNLRGYKSVTMDDLAKSLGMSKRTLYQYFSSKEEVAAYVVNEILQEINRAMDQVQLSPDPIRGIRETIEQVKGNLLQLNPIFMDDLKRYLPELWERLEDIRGNKFKLLVESALCEAQLQGYRLAFNPRVSAAILVASAQAVIQPEFIIRNGFTVSEVADTLIGIFISGLSASK